MFQVTAAFAAACASKALGRLRRRLVCKKGRLTREAFLMAALVIFAADAAVAAVPVVPGVVEHAFEEVKHLLVPLAALLGHIGFLMRAD